VTPDRHAEVLASLLPLEDVAPGDTPDFSGWRGYLRQFNPFGITGGHSIFPLMVMALLATVGSWDDLAFPFLLLFFIRIDFGFDFTFLLTISAVVGLVTVAMGPLVGYYADRMSRVWMLRIGALISNASSVALALAPGPGFLIAARTIGAFGPGIENPPKFPLLADYYPPHTRARVVAFVQAVSLLGGSIGVMLLIFAVLVLDVHWRVVLLVSGGVATLVSLATFLLREPVRGGLDREASKLRARRLSGLDSAGADADADADADLADLEEPDAPEPPPGWAEAWRVASSIRTLRRIWYATPFITVSSGIGNVLVFALMAKQATNRDASWGSSLFASPHSAYIFILVPTLLAAFSTIYAGGVTDRLLRNRPGRIMVFAGVSQAATGLVLVSLLFIPVKYFLLAYIPLFAVTIISSMIVPAQMTLLMQIIPSRVRALGMQTIAPWTFLGYLFLPVVGVVADRQGPFAAVLLLVPVMLIGAYITASGGQAAADDLRAAAAADSADEARRLAQMSGTSKLVVARQVEVAYDGATVLHGIDLDVEEGELLALLGTNGAGKSTLLRALCGLVELSAGAVLVDGKDTAHRPAHLNARDGLIFLPGGRAVFPSMTVAENLAAAEQQSGGSRTRDEVLALFPQLLDRMDVRAGDLSGGEQQMLALAQCFLMRPRLLMIDELSLGLAPSVVSRLLDVVREINAAGTTVVLVEQSVNVALTVARRAVFLEHGRVRFDGPTEQLLGRPDLVRAVFLGRTGQSVSAAPRRRAVSDTPVLEVSDVVVDYGGVRALDGVGFSVRAGQVLGVIGPNGAGKTSLFDVVSGLVTPTSGHVVLNGRDVSRLPVDERARLGLVRSFQAARLFPSLTVREALAVALERHLSGSRLGSIVPSRAASRTTAKIDRRVDNLLGLLGLQTFAESFVRELSTGQRRIVELACVVAAEPSVMLLDEPSSGMAQGEIELLGPLVRRVAAETNAAVVLVEHDLPLVSGVCDEVLALELGRVLALGATADVLTDDRVVQSYMAADSASLQRSGDLSAVLPQLLASTRGVP